MKRQEHIQPTAPGSPSLEGHGALGTIGLHEELIHLAEWAYKNGLLHPLLLVIDITGHHKYVGTVLHYLSDRMPAELIKLWSPEHPFLPGLADLTNAFSSCPELQQRYRRAPTDAPLRGQMFDGELTQYLVAALTTRPISFTVDDNVRWLEKVRLWCVIKFIECAYAGVPPPKRLADTAVKLRQAIDNKPVAVDWLDIFVRLRTGAQTFYQVQTDLLRRAGELSTDPIFQNVNSGRLFLEKLSRFDESNDTTMESSSTPWTRFFMDSVATTLSGLNQQPHLVDWVDSDGSTSVSLPTLYIELLGTNATAHFIQLEGHESAAEESKLGNSVLLLSIEDQQHLPMSWNRPNRDERTRLVHWLSAPGPNDTDLAAWALISALSHRSPRMALHLGIGSASTDDWQLDPRTMQLHRTPPRHKGSKPPLDSSHLAPWIDRIDLELPLWASQFLWQRWMATPDATTLFALFNAETATSLQQRLCDHLFTLGGSTRITPASIAQWSGQEIFENTLDPVLTQLLTSQKRTGLPGSCAYASYTVHTVASNAELIRLAPPVRFTPTQGVLNTNAAGSFLDVEDAWLAQCFRTALAHIRALSDSPQAWIEHHNALTSYLTGVLLAATGARPVSSPFESPEDFDFSRGIVFVDDKSVSSLHTGRLLPLPNLVCDHIQTIYLPHLAQIAQITRDIAPVIGEAIQQLSQGLDSGKLPFFFFLQARNGQLRSFEVTPSSLSNLGFLNLDLALNVLRHRYSTGLKRMGVDHEVVNGLMGHSENGTATWGTNSMRCWNDDIRIARPMIGQLLDRLEIQRPYGLSRRPLPQEIGVFGAPELDSNQVLYGRKARSTRRSLSRERATLAARHDIERLYTERLKTTRTLTREDMDRMAAQLRVQHNGLPHPWESLRYQEFLEWRERHPHLPIPVKRYIPRNEEPSPFAQTGTHAIQKLGLMLSWLRGTALDDAKHGKQRRLALFAGISHLIIESRVSNDKVVAELLQNKNYRIVKLQNTFHLECGANIDSQPDAPVQRYKISHLAAFRLTAARESTYTLSSTEDIDDAYHSLIDALALDLPVKYYRDLFKQLTAIMDQANWQELPGTYAAFLRGTVVSVGLQHQDWIRLHTGTAKQVPELSFRRVSAERAKQAASKDDDAQEESLTEEEDTVPDEFRLSLNATALAMASSGRNIQTQISIPKKYAKKRSAAVTSLAPPEVLGNASSLASLHEAKSRSQALMKSVGDCLKSASSRTTGIRRDIDKKLRLIVKENATASSACLLFVEWVRSLLTRRTSRGHLAISSIERYFQPLAPCFEQLAYAVDICNLDAEDITELYATMMEARKARNWQIRHSNSAVTKVASPEDAETDESSGTAYKSWTLAYWTLKEFHRFARQHIALEEPDWSDIDCEDATKGIAAHTILEGEYLHAQQLLVPDVENANLGSLQKSLLLLLAYRFGLRGAEAINLQRCDWVQLEGSHHPLMILVRSNALHRLKTASSRRQVPLIFELTSHEKSIIQRYLDLWRGETGDSSHEMPLFPGLAGKSNITRSLATRLELTRLLKDVTQNKSVSLHTARHTFGSLAMLLLHVDGHMLLRQYLVTPPSEEWRRHVQKSLLSTEKDSRRSLWALARLLGHSHPRMSLRSYVHLLPELTYTRLGDSILPQSGRKLSPIRLDQILNFDNLSANQKYLSPPLTPLTTAARRPTAVMVMKALRLFAKGLDCARIASFCGVAIEDIERIRELLAQCDAVLARYPKANPGRGAGSILLSHIGMRRLDWLTQYAKGIELKPMQSLTAADVSTLSPTGIVGPSRHLLLFQEPHFRFMASLVVAWSIPAQQVHLVAAPKLSDRVRTWATDQGLLLTNSEDIVVAPRTLTRKKPRGHRDTTTERKRYFKIDPVVTGDPPVQVMHRCAALFTSGHPGPIDSSYELVLLALIQLFFVQAPLSSGSEIGT